MVWTSLRICLVFGKDINLLKELNENELDWAMSVSTFLYKDCNQDVPILKNSLY